MRSDKNKLSARERGVAIVIVAAMSMVVFPMVGLSLDAGVLFVVRAKLSAAADSAAVAGARSLRRGADISTQAANAQITAQNYFRANFPSSFLLSNSSSITTNVSQLSNSVRQVVTNVTAQIPVSFLRVLPGVGPTVTVNVSATTQRRDSNLVLVMDRSGSLADSGSCAPMKAAASGFVQMFSEQRDWMGMVTFASSSHYMEYPLASNFKTSSPTLPNVIAGIQCDGYTSSAMGLWNGYTALAELNQPGALNVIVFFTDGDPTSITAQFPLKSTSSCPAASKPPYPPNTPLLGVLAGASGPWGLMPLSNGLVPIADDEALQSGTTVTGCGFLKSGSRGDVGNDVQYIPDLDYFGDNLRSGYQSVNTSGGHITVTSNNVDDTAINATDEAAKHIRRGDPITAVVPGAPPGAIGKSLQNVIIFSIGLGSSSNPPNADLLRRVANDPGSSIYDSSKPKGLYVFAKSASDLNDAFLRVASEVLRLSK